MPPSVLHQPADKRTVSFRVCSIFSRCRQDTADTPER